MQHMLKLYLAALPKHFNDMQFTGDNNCQFHLVKIILFLLVHQLTAVVASQLLPMSCPWLQPHQPLNGGLLGNKDVFNSEFQLFIYIYP